VIADWARSGRSGRYTPSGMPRDLDQRMAHVDLPVLAIQFSDDPFGPASSLQGLLAKLRSAKATVRTLASDELGVRADHFSWMREPRPIVDEICVWLDTLAKDI
jgi:predicted alpha/beta hydrolase